MTITPEAAVAISHELRDKLRAVVREVAEATRDQDITNEEGMNILLSAFAETICPVLLVAYGETGRARRLCADLVRDLILRTMQGYAGGAAEREMSGGTRH